MFLSLPPLANISAVVLVSEVSFLGNSHFSERLEGKHLSLSFA